MIYEKEKTTHRLGRKSSQNTYKSDRRLMSQIFKTLKLNRKKNNPI